MAAAKTPENMEAGAADAQKRKRVKARWGMLRKAILGSSPSSSSSGTGSGAGGDANATSHKSDDSSSGNGSNSRFHELSMNAFPGFRVLDRTVLLGAAKDGTVVFDEDILRDDSGCDNHDESRRWDVVQNSYASPGGRVVQFLTRETKQEDERRPYHQQVGGGPKDKKSGRRKSTIQTRMEALLSHRHHGVDNTGNVRVWDAEGTLAGFLLSLVLDCGEHGDNGDDVGSLAEVNQKNIRLMELRRDIRAMLVANDTSGASTDGGAKYPTCNLLELGAGQAGLAGLSMAAASKDADNQMKPLRVVLTDGHPKCIENNEACAKMMVSSSTPEGQRRFRVDARLLLWESSPKGAMACSRINELVGDLPSLANVGKINSYDDEGMYQICLASDCVHFQDFHDGLLTTIARTLVVGGIALLCQPTRGSSLGNFMALADAVNRSQVDGSSSREGNISRRDPLFQVMLFEDFHPKVSAMHKSLVPDANSSYNDTTSDASKLQPSSQYDPNLHRPLLLAFRKLRSYDEEIDGRLVHDQFISSILS